MRHRAKCQALLLSLERHNLLIFEPLSYLKDTDCTMKARDSASPSPKQDWWTQQNTEMNTPSKHHALKTMPAAARHALATMRSPPCDRKYTTIIQSPPRKHHMIKNIQTRHKAITTRLSPPEHLAIITVQLSLNYQASTMRLPS